MRVKRVTHFVNAHYVFAKTSTTITSPMATPIQNAPDRSSCTRLRFSDEVELLTLALSFVYWRRPHTCHAGMSSEAPVAQAIRNTTYVSHRHRQASLIGGSAMTRPSGWRSPYVTHAMDRRARCLGESCGALTKLRRLGKLAARYCRLRKAASVRTAETHAA